jgi:hypothetical protein
MVRRRRDLQGAFALPRAARIYNNQQFDTTQQQNTQQMKYLTPERSSLPQADRRIRTDPTGGAFPLPSFLGDRVISREWPQKFPSVGSSPTGPGRAGAASGVGHVCAALRGRTPRPMWCARGGGRPLSARLISSGCQTGRTSRTVGRPRPWGAPPSSRSRTSAPFSHRFCLSWRAGWPITPARLQLALRCMLPAAVRNRTVKAKEAPLRHAVRGTNDLTPRRRNCSNLPPCGAAGEQSDAGITPARRKRSRRGRRRGPPDPAARQMRRDPRSLTHVLPTRPLPLMPEQAAALAQ